MSQSKADETIQCEHMWVMMKDPDGWSEPHLECHMCGIEKTGREMWVIWAEGCKWHGLLQDLGFLYGER